MLSKLITNVFLFGLLGNAAFINAQDTAITKHQVYGYRDGLAMYYDVEAPLESNGKGIILVVSGGMVSGTDNLNIVKPFWKVFLDEGYTLFQLYHPAHPTYRIPDAYEALKLGIADIKTNSLKFGVDRNRLGLFGVSTGGFLALLLSMSIDPSERSFADIEAVIALMPPVDVQDPAFDLELFGARLLDFDPALYSVMSPINHVSSDDPPVLLIHGTNDQAVSFERNSVRMKAELDKAGVDSRLVAVDAGHETFREPHLSNVHAEMVAWFNRYLN